MNAKAKLIIDDQTIELPFEHESKDGPILLDTHTLFSHGILSFDHGFGSTAGCQSAISSLDGQAGKLYYRGYAIEDLGKHCDYLATAYLLLEGQWPTKDQLSTFTHELHQLGTLPKDFASCLDGMPQDAHPMALLSTLISALIGHDKLDSERWNGANKRSTLAKQIVARMPTLVAMCARHNQGKSQAFIRTDLLLELGYTGQFLHNVFANSDAPYQASPAVISAMEAIFILHADHSQNASTSAVRVCGSTGSSPLFGILTGLGTLSGPAHGGANEACLNMLQTIGSIDKIPEYLARAKDSDDPFRLMGFGHRVYKNYDPRAKVMHTLCHEVLAQTKKQDDPLFALALKLEQIALEDSYFIERKLYPNIDFYSGITMNAMGIPTNLFTPIFALSRSCGWMAHWLEMHQESSLRLSRPRQWYVGHSPRNLPA